MKDNYIWVMVAFIVSSINVVLGFVSGAFWLFVGSSIFGFSFGIILGLYEFGNSTTNNSAIQNSTEVKQNG